MLHLPSPLYFFLGGGATGRNGGHLTPVSALHYSALSANSQSYLLKHLNSSSSKREEVYGNDVGSKSDEVIRKMLTLEQRTSGELLVLIRSSEAEKRKAEMKRKALDRAENSKPVEIGKEEKVIDAELVSGNNWYLCFSEVEENACDESLEKARRAGLSDLARNVRKVTKKEIDEVSS